MPTKTTEKTAVKPIANAKILPLAKEYTSTKGEQMQRKVAMAHAMQSEAKRLGADKAECRAILAATFAQAIGVPANASDELTLVYLKDWQSDISRVMTLAFPDAPDELAKAIAHNAKAKNNLDRIGEVKLLDIARGNMSFADTIERKVKARGGRPDGNSVTVKAEGKTAREQFTSALRNSLAQFVGQSGTDRLTIAEARKVAAELLDKREEELKAATAAK